MSVCSYVVDFGRAVVVVYVAPNMAISGKPKAPDMQTQPVLTGYSLIANIPHSNWGTNNMVCNPACSGKSMGAVPTTT